VDAFVLTLKPADVAGIKAFWAGGQRGVPPEFDGPMLAIGRTHLNRILQTPEKRAMRHRFTAAVKAMP
jgi:hypothetical protein